MQFYITKPKIIKESLINEVTLGVGQYVQGCVFFNNEHKVIKYPSLWLSKITEVENLSYSTAETYARNMTYFLDFLDQEEDLKELTLDEKLLHVTKHKLIKWINSLKQKDLDKGTIRNRETAIKAFYHFISDGELITKLIKRSPFPSKWLSSKPDQKAVVGATVNDLITLIQFSPYERERAMLQFMFDSGLRVSEVERVTFGDIKEAIAFTRSQVGKRNDDETFHPSYAPLKVQGSKGRENSIKERITLVSRPTLERLALYHSSPLYKKYQMKYSDKGECPAFLNSDGNVFKKAAIQKLIQRLNKKAIKNKAQIQHLYPHKFRHGSALMTLQDENLGNDFLERLVNVKKTLGHVFISTSERYTDMPHDVIDALNPENDQVKTTIEQMQRVYDETRLKIKLRDKK
ncbi:tyrosine-type recombinase/integrase [Thalassotalea agarivorans]|uniref:Integrase/recombinase XerC n=1 Tax=Thalassotalea agarivorans TaxID=349064 RepID=A0A1H9ZJ85_THASX|nr:tyrosine-type recombinase/integrase [Thalassotalea agarivorans]SES81730.1 integrase/recombinase XerC [Thalassotalea agarivorans]